MRDEGASGPDRGRTRGAGGQGAGASAREGAVEEFLAVVALWQREAWGEIYDGATARSRKVVTRRAFAQIMDRTGARLAPGPRPAEVTGVSSGYPTLVEIAATLAYRHPRRESRTDTFQMEWEDGAWRISVVALLYAGPEEVPPPLQIEH